MNISRISHRFDRKDIIFDRETNYGPRIQTNLQLVYVLKGTTRVTIDQKSEYLINAGEVILLFPGHSEFFHFTKGTHHGWCYAFLEDDRRGFVDEGICARRVAPFTPAMRRIDQTLEEGDRGCFKFGTLTRNALIASLFYSYLDVSEWSSETLQVLHPSVEKADRILRAKYRESLTLREIACGSGLSVAHLIRLYKLAHGVTPIKRLWEIRLSEASVLLRETGLTTYEISDRCGFSNPQHFSKAFTRYFGATPKQYRVKR